MRDPLDVSDPAQRRKVIAAVALFGAALVIMLIVRPSWLNAVLIVGGLTLVVMLHEFGHFIAAKKTGMKATEFFVGFGPRIWSFRRGETEYGLKALPLGGYVRIIGMNNVEEVPPEDEPRTYRASTTPRKLIVILAGVTVNLILAFLCIASVFMIKGRPYLETGRPIVGGVTEGSPAARSGLRASDRIVSVNGTPITTFDELPPLIAQSADREVALVVVRNGSERTVLVTPRVDSDGVVRIGIGLGGELRYERYNPVEAVGETFAYIGQTGVRMVEGIGKLVTPSFLRDYAQTVKEGDAANPNRPRTVIGIGRETSQAMDRDPWQLLVMLGALNLFLALFNLIPLLPFDGGHAVIAGYEGAASKIRKRKVVVDYNRMAPIAMGVLVLLLVLAVPALILDISQFF